MTSRINIDMASRSFTPKFGDQVAPFDLGKAMSAPTLKDAHYICVMDEIDERSPRKEVRSPGR